MRATKKMDRRGTLVTLQSDPRLLSGFTHLAVMPDLGGSAGSRRAD